jgi:hypothetical protein
VIVSRRTLTIPTRIEPIQGSSFDSDWLAPSTPSSEDREFPKLHRRDATRDGLAGYGRVQDLMTDEAAALGGSRALMKSLRPQARSSEV